MKWLFAFLFLPHIAWANCEQYLGALRTLDQLNIGYTVLELTDHSLHLRLDHFAPIGKEFYVMHWARTEHGIQFEWKHPLNGNIAQSSQHWVVMDPFASLDAGFIMALVHEIVHSMNWVNYIRNGEGEPLIYFFPQGREEITEVRGVYRKNFRSDEYEAFTLSANHHPDPEMVRYYLGLGKDFLAQIPWLKALRSNVAGARRPDLGVNVFVIEGLVRIRLPQLLALSDGEVRAMVDRRLRQIYKTRAHVGH